MRRHTVIYADPPWRYSDTRHGFGGAEDDYSTERLAHRPGDGDQLMLERRWHKCSTVS